MIPMRAIQLMRETRERDKETEEKGNRIFHGDGKLNYRPV